MLYVYSFPLRIHLIRVANSTSWIIIRNKRSKNTGRVGAEFGNLAYLEVDGNTTQKRFHRLLGLFHECFRFEPLDFANATLLARKNGQQLKIQLSDRWDVPTEMSCFRSITDDPRRKRQSSPQISSAFSK